MRIERVAIKNLRCIEMAHVSLSPYTCLVGANGAGKSTLLCALNIFFRNTASVTNVLRLSPEDYHLLDTTKPVEITVTFGELSAEAIEEFKGYVRQGQLIVSAVASFDDQARVGEVRQFGERLGMNSFAPFFKRAADNAKVGELKPIYEQYQSTAYPELPQWKSLDHALNALREYEAERPDQCVLLRSEDQFYGATKGQGKLDRFVQWVYVPAVKDATEEEAENRSSALGKLLARTVRKKVDFDALVDEIVETAKTSYEKMLSDHQQVLGDLSVALTRRLQEWAHPDATLTIEWQQDAAKSISATSPLAGVIAGEANFRGKLARFGHGFQRSFILSILQELASAEDDVGPTLILGCEEPELYQHPPQARHLASVFATLASRGSQVLITTHSPHFVSGTSFEGVRMVARNSNEKCSRVSQYSYKQLAEDFSAVTGKPLKNDSAILVKVHQILQPTLSEMFFTQRLVFVEGLEDVAYIQAWMILSGRWGEFRRLGCHIVPCSGKSEIIRPALIARGLGIPHVAIFDSDSSKQGKKDEALHRSDNTSLIRIFGGHESFVFPKDTVWSTRYVAWAHDFSTAVEEDIRNQIGDKLFELIKGEVCSEFDYAGDLNKAALYIGTLLTVAQQHGATSKSLDCLCDWLIAEETFNPITTNDGEA